MITGETLDRPLWAIPPLPDGTPADDRLDHEFLRPVFMQELLATNRVLAAFDYWHLYLGTPLRLNALHAGLSDDDAITELQALRKDLEGTTELAWDLCQNLRYPWAWLAGMLAFTFNAATLTHAVGGRDGVFEVVAPAQPVPDSVGLTVNPSSLKAALASAKLIQAALTAAMEKPLNTARRRRLTYGVRWLVAHDVEGTAWNALKPKGNRTHKKDVVDEVRRILSLGSG